MVSDAMTALFIVNITQEIILNREFRGTHQNMADLHTNR
jgi:hypothetical protein